MTTEKKESFNDIIAGDTPVLIDFFATWCGPCQYQAPILEEVGQSMGEKVRIIKIDVDRNQELATKLSIRGVPTLMIFKKGEIKWRTSGVKQKEELITILNQHIS